jgi:hypothetical protein
MQNHSRAFGALLAPAAVLAACATTAHSKYDPGSLDGGGGLSSGGGSTSDATLNISSSSGAGDARGARAQRCDDAGRCTCFNIASIGQPGCSGCEAAGAGGDTTSSFVSYLNLHSSANVDTYTTKPTLTADFLSRYDVIIIQGLYDGCSGKSGNPPWSIVGNTWTFAASEITALQAWVKAGGGVITLSGFVSNTTEVQPLNSVIGPVTNNDITYGTDDIHGQDLGGQTFCLGESDPLGNWVTTLQNGNADPIGQGIGEIGAFHGRPIHVAPGSSVVIDNQDGTYVYAAHEDIGMGHVFAFFDEWVTYTSQWPGGAAGSVCQMGCVPDATAGAVYQVPEFWQNAVNYAAAATMCPMFTITIPM